MSALRETVYRLRLPLFLGGALLAGGATLLRRILPDGPQDVPLLWLARAGLVAIALWLVVVLATRGRHPQHEERTVRSPVVGRWLALNSPASTVPSHGTRAYGQSHAIDLVAEPDDAERPAFGTAGAFRRNEDYPAFGEPVHAMVSGVVVDSSSWRRDHRARSNGWGLAYLTIEGMVRELGGPGWIVGNHVTIRTADGTFALVAHLQRGSATVRRGDVVSAGDVIGRCGNSGNSSEPHVHAQLMDRRSLWTAAGVPMAFAGISLGDAAEPVDGLPANGEHLMAARTLSPDGDRT
ncbi:M23 family metallopeptidase [Georgenia sp. Z1344]|uniref:M23 family metallopeptidase n=1 Tax=Georgenia sp. Z1344 TaxID=3416706 RepID=UPI003CEDF8D2